MGGAGLAVAFAHAGDYRLRPVACARCVAKGTPAAREERSVKTKLSLLVALVPAIALAQSATAPQAPAMPDVSSHTMVMAKDIKWGEAPPALPKGAMIAVLSGDPGKAGPFAIRLKFPAGYKVPRHWHP